MPDIFVSSNAVGLNDGTSKADAFLAYQSALDAWAPGDRIFLDVLHYETAASFSYDSLKTSHSDTMLTVSIDFTTDQYKPAASPQFVSTAGNIVFQDAGVYAGLNLDASGGIRFCDSKAYSQVVFDGYFKSAGQFFYTRSTQGKVDFRRCTFDTSGAFYFYSLSVEVNLYSCRFKGSTTNNNYSILAGTDSVINFHSCDFTEYLLTDAQYLYYFYNGANESTQYNFERCKFPSGNWGMNIYPPKSVFQVARFFECVKTGVAGYVDYVEYFMGIVMPDISVYRSGGYSDSISSAIKSLKIIPNSVTSKVNKLETEPLKIYSASGGTKKITVFIAHDFTNPLTGADFNIDVDYEVDGSGTYDFINSSAIDPTYSIDVIGNSGDLSTSTENWVNGAALTKQQVEVTVPVFARSIVKLALGFSTYEAGKVCYVCPKPLVEAV